jgi:hypothetical protein
MEAVFVQLKRNSTLLTGHAFVYKETAGITNCRNEFICVITLKGETLKDGQVFGMQAHC